jgi:peptidylprolyl isomerase
MLGDRSYLDGNYTVFGEAVAGLDVVMRIAQGDTVERVRIIRVGAKAEAFRPTTESFRAMVQEAQKRVADHIEKKREAERAWIARNHPKAAGPADGVLVEQLTTGAAPAAAGSPRRIRYRGTALRYVGMIVGRDGPPLEEIPFASTESGSPDTADAQPFRFEPGKTKINPGFDQAAASMSPGERRILIVPAAMAYGRPGIYSPEVSGRKRLVISPDTMLVYDVEVLPN